MIKSIEKNYLDESFIHKSFIDSINLKEKISFNKNDIYYFGNYNKDTLKLIKEKIINNKKSILKAVERGVKFIIYGNSIELFNNSFNYKDINLFTTYDKKKEFIVIDDISKGINTYNFRYKNLICINDIKVFKKHKKRQSKLLCHTNFKW